MTRVRLLWFLSFVLTAWFVPRPIQAKDCSDAPIRVMTYNIRLDTPNDSENRWANRRRWMTEQIRWLNPQIFGLQEVVPAQKQDFISDFPDYSIVGAGRDDGKDTGEASPIAFAKALFTLQASGTFWLSETPDKPGKGWDAAYPRVASWARLSSKCGAGKLLVINTHWDHIGAEARVQSAKQISAWIEGNRRRGERLLLLGDFNTEIESAPMQLLINGGELQDARAIAATLPFGPDGSFNAFQLQPAPAPAIDHILVGGQWTVERHATIAQNVNGRMISDHYPVLADLRPLTTKKSK